MNLKNILKSLKLNESSISMVLGAIVIVVVGVLVINFFKKEKGDILPGATTEQKESKQIPVKGQTYTVIKGDTLWTISENSYGSGYNWIDIAKENTLKNPSFISEGQKLVIPDVEAKIATKGIVSEKETNGSISGATYTVVKGDNLWKISIRAYGDGYQWVKIARENNLKNPNLIHPGNVLTLPRP